MVGDYKFVRPELVEGLFERNFNPSTQASLKLRRAGPPELSPGRLLPSLSRWSGRTGSVL